MNELGLYLGATRIGRSDIPVENSRLLYSSTIDALRSTIAGIGRDYCEVAIVYTLNRVTEITRISGRTTLVYDRYVGQAMSALTRVLYWSNDVRVTTRAIAKIFGEQAIIAGDAAGAAVGLMASAANNEHWNLPLSISDAEVATLIHLQEIFIFSHEYCHMIMANDSKFASSRLAVGDILIEGPDLSERDNEKAYASFAERYPNYQSYEEWSKTGRDDLEFVKKHTNDIRVEIACDDFALGILLEHCKRWQIDPREAFKSAFLALRNIRVLAYLRRLANPRLVRMGKATTTPERLLQKRQHLLRSGFALAASAHGVEKELASIQAELMDLSDLHDKQIDFPLLFNIVPQLHKARNKVLKKGGSSRLPEPFVVARGLGWNPDADEIECLLM